MSDEPWRVDEIEMGPLDLIDLHNSVARERATADEQEMFLRCDHVYELTGPHAFLPHRRDRYILMVYGPRSDHMILLTQTGYKRWLSRYAGWRQTAARTAFRHFRGSKTPAEIRLMELHTVAGQLNTAEYDLDVRKKLCDGVTKLDT
mgnify:CR=1 FL=1